MNKRYLIPLLFLFIFLGCGSPDIADSGSGTGTGNPFFTGIAVSSKGEPLQNCPLQVFRTTENSDSSDFLGSGFNERGICYTDDNGLYHFELTQPGEYRVEFTACNHEEALSIPLSVEAGDTVISQDTVYLLPMDTCTGKIRLYGNDDDDVKIEISALESNRTDTIEDGDHFSIPLPHGLYTLVIKPISDEYDTKYLVDIESDSALGTIKILAKTPISESFTCDSLIVRAILDSNGLQTTKVSEVSRKKLLINRMRDLDLKISSINKIIPEIGGLSSLRELEIQNTNITMLPPSIGNLKNLTELELQNNKLTTLPVEISNLKNLNELVLSGNLLTDLPVTVKEWADRFDPDWKIKQKSE